MRSHSCILPERDCSVGDFTPHISGGGQAVGENLGSAGSRHGTMNNE